MTKSRRLSFAALVLAGGLLATSSRAENLVDFGPMQTATLIYVDILDFTTETIRWQGSVKVDILDESGTTVKNNLSNNGIFTPTYNGWYRVRLDNNEDNAWDLSVLRSGTPVNGRVYSPNWNFWTSSSGGSADLSMYTLVPGGDVDGDNTGVVEIKLSGFNGVLFTVSSNQFGLVGTNGRSSATQGAAAIKPSYNVYINPPEKASYTAIAPIIGDQYFNAGDGGLTCSSIEPGINTGTFEFVSNVAGGYELVCDINGDGLLIATSDLDTSRIGSVTPGTNTVYWDGMDNTGAPVAAGTYNCSLVVTVGDFHFMASDAEVNYPGMTMYEVVSDGSGGFTRNPLPMFWNDEFVQADAVAMDNGELSLERPAGDTGMLSAPYASTPTPNTDSRAWGRFNASGNVVFADKGDTNTLDTYTRLRASASFDVVVTITDGGDADGDTITDTTEDCITGSDPDSTDSDGDGIPDIDEVTPNGGGDPTYVDTDGDGIPDAQDTDSNNNGIPDGDEGTGDDDGDGVPNFRDGLVAITTPEYINSATPTITGTGDLTRTVDVWVDSVLWCTAAPIDAAGEWSCAPGANTLSEGAHTIDVEMDDGGTPVSGSKDIFVDTVAPTITFDLTGVVTDPRPAVSGTTEPLASLDVFVDGDLVCSTTADSGGLWSCPWPGARSDLSVGGHTVSATAQDLAGNTGAGSNTFTYDFDECMDAADNDCDAIAICTNTLGSFTCACPSGYTDTNGDGTLCTDIDECATNNGGCDTLVTCTNTPGSSSCGACPSGYTDTNSDGTLCTEIDECTAGTDNCADEATCSNTDGSFTCTCNSGYSGDGVSCADDDECADGTDNCDAVATCSNTAGSFTCTCPSGYTDTYNDGTLCTDIDECTTNNGGCDETATCSNTDGGATCTCPAGSTGDGFACTPLEVLDPEADSVVGLGEILISGTAEHGIHIVVTSPDNDGCEADVDENGDWSCTLSGLDDGPVDITVSDEDGQAQVELTVTVDTTTSIEISTPDEAALLNEVPENVAGTAEPGASVQVTVDGENLCTVEADAQGDWSCPLGDLDEGRHEIVAEVDDGVNQASDTVTWTLDSSTEVAITAPVGETSETLPTISGTGEPGATVTVQIDGDDVGSTTVAEDGTWTLPLTDALEEGTHDVAVSAEDPAGNIAEDSSDFEIGPDLTDSDGDGIPDAVENVPPGQDSDGDGTPDYLDADDDNDGVPTIDELGDDGEIIDSDDDGTPDYLDEDDDNDNVPTVEELDIGGQPFDTDGDGVNDYLDTDDDDDGLLTRYEDPDGDGHPQNDDSDADGVPNYLDPDDDGDGKPTVEEDCDPNQDGNPDDALDANANGVPDYLDAEPFDDGSGQAVDPYAGFDIAGGGCACAAGAQDSGSAPGAGLLLLGLLGLLWRRRRDPQQPQPKGHSKAVFFSAFVAIWTVFSGAPLRAQTVDPQTFKPTVFSNDLLSVYDAQGMDPWGFDLGLTLHYQHDPVVLRDKETLEIGRRILEHQLMADLVGGFSFFKWLDLGFALPVVLMQTGEGWPGGQPPSMAGLADLRIVPRLSFLDLDDGKLSLAFLPQLSAPIGGLMDPMLGEKNFTFRPTFAIGSAWPWFRASANLLYVVREAEALSNITIDQQLGIKLGILAYAWPETLDVIGELSMATNTFDPFAANYQNQMEWLGALRYHGPMGMDFDLGTGTALSPGFATPDFRLFAGMRWTYALARDSDNDGIEDEVDRCPEHPEDIDGFEDSDGCPDLDNDKDGVPDLQDAAPDDPEDKDAYQDEDGKPDPDNDGDGILDAKDACPLEAETVNQFNDDDGCPDTVPDSDGDGLLDDVDKCPNDAEDVDKFADQDGCPDPDNDKDGVLDTADNCPNEAGSVENKGCPDTDRDGDGVVDRSDNCPDEPGDPNNQGCKKKQLVVLTAEKIEILKKVYFATNKAVIRSVSFKLLDNVAKVLNEHPELDMVRVEGHTDSVGNAASNKRLSQRRAEAVRDYLVKKGVKSQRLRPMGWGEEQPIASNKNKAGRAENRRVEFNIGDNPAMQKDLPELQVP